VAVLFTPYLGVKLLPEIKPIPGGHDAIYATPRYERLRRIVRACVDRRRLVVGLTAAAFVLSAVGMGRGEEAVLPLLRPARGAGRDPAPAGLGRPQHRRGRRPAWKPDLQREPEAEVVTSYIGAGAARFFLSLNPEQPDPGVRQDHRRTPDAEARAALSAKLASGSPRAAIPRPGPDRPPAVRPARALSRRVSGRRRRPRSDPDRGRSGP
jgi:multidrug efflux pump subunit AcrB